MKIPKSLDPLSFGLIVLLAVLVVVTAAMNWRLVGEQFAPPPPTLSAEEAAQLFESDMAARAAQTASFIESLKGADPDEWHRLANGWNWDAGVEPLAWIVRQPDCDRATALLIYWRSGPGWSAQYVSREDVPAHELDAYDLEREIEDRYLAGGYTRQEIAWDPRHDDGYDWVERYADKPQKRPIPAQMSEALTGRIVTGTSSLLRPALR